MKQQSPKADQLRAMREARAKRAGHRIEVTKAGLAALEAGIKARKRKKTKKPLRA